MKVLTLDERASLARRLAHWSEPEPNTGCHLWRGSLSPGGYASIGVGRRFFLRAHRAAYELAKGPIPEGLQIDHLCRVRCCVNPDHLEAVTQRVNLLRGFSPHAIFARRTHCHRGHEYTPENTRMKRNRKNTRICRTCHKENVQAAWAQRHRSMA